MSRRIRLLLAGLGIFVVALLVFFLLINPIRGDVGELQSKIEDEELLITRAENELANAAKTKAEGRQNQARLLEFAKMIPEDAEVPSLILQIQDLSAKAGIDFIKISPGQAKASGAAYEIVPLSLTFKGTFFDVSDFIYRAEQMVAGPGRLLTVKSLGLTPLGESTGTSVTTKELLSVTMSMYAFVAPSAGSAPAPAAADTTATTVPSGTTQ